MSTNPNEALARAVSGQSTANYSQIIRGFMEKGIAADDIRPRENVFTFAAWQAKGRTVRRGQRGVRCVTFVPMLDKATDQTIRRPRTTSVFHVSQTDPIGAQAGSYTPTRYDVFSVGTATDAQLAVIAQGAKGKALLELDELECSAMMEQMRRAQAVATPAEVGETLANAAAIDITPERNQSGCPVCGHGSTLPHGQTCPNCHNGTLEDEMREQDLAKRRIEIKRADRIQTPQLPPISSADMRTARERVLAGEPVSILDLMPDKIDARPGHYTRLKPTVKKRNFEF